MPTDGYFVCMPIVIINSKPRGAEQDSVQYMMQVVLTTERKSHLFYRTNTSAFLVSTTFIIYGTESCSAPLSLELIIIMGMHTEHPSVGMLSLSHPIGMHIEHPGHAETSEHAHRTS